MVTIAEKMKTKDEYIIYANNNFKIYYYDTKIQGRTGSNPRGFKQVSVLKMGSILEENNLILKAFYSLIVSDLHIYCKTNF